jgi:hypothetical protein
MYDKKRGAYGIRHHLGRAIGFTEGGLPKSQGSISSLTTYAT